MPSFSSIRNFFRSVHLPDSEVVEFAAERFGETITPNMRALRLSMTVADYLLSMGVSASDATYTSLDITDKYCKRKVSIEIIASVLMFSQDRGNDREPLTLIRTSPTRDVNSALIQSIIDVVDDIRDGKLTLDQAEDRMEMLLDHPMKYPQSVLSLGSAAISAGIGSLLSGSPLIIAISFVVGGIISYILLILARKRIPPFFIQVAAAAVATLIAAAVTYLGNHGVHQFDGLDPNLIIIGGIVMLVAGLAIVGAVQDAIDEFYVTANSRILRVVMMTAGIVAGIIIGLYIAKKMGVTMTINTNKPIYDILSWQYAGAVTIAAGYALSVNARISGIILSGLIGASGWAVYVNTLPHFPATAASFMAAAAVGVIATFISRLFHTPTTIMITAGIVSLVPGLSLFNGLMLLIIGTTKGGVVMGSGNDILLNALLVALAIAAGATFGNLIARPVRQTLVRARSALPRRDLSQ